MFSWWKEVGFIHSIIWFPKIWTPFFRFLKVRPQNAAPVDVPVVVGVYSADLPSKWHLLYLGPHSETTLEMLLHVKIWFDVKVTIEIVLAAFVIKLEMEFSVCMCLCDLNFDLTWKFSRKNIQFLQKYLRNFREILNFTITVIWLHTNIYLLHSTNWTAAMAGIFSLNFCVRATRTVITPAAGPLSRTFTT